MSKARQKGIAKGFTYLMLLWWVAVGSVMLAALGQQWAFERKRQKEIDMVFRAHEIQRALGAYYAAAPASQPRVWPVRLEDLLEDRRGPVVQRHLRQLWKDPLTGRSNWGLIRAVKVASAPGTEQAGAVGGITGIYSQAKGKPIRAPEGITHYDEWRFEATPGSSGL
jgi:type II secretory pathway pseudopilin PulG